MKGVDRMNTDDIAREYGRQNHQKLVDRYPNTVLQSGLWMVGMWDILSKADKGEYDPVIKQFSTWAKETDRPVYLQIMSRHTGGSLTFSAPKVPTISHSYGIHMQLQPTRATRYQPGTLVMHM